MAAVEIIRRAFEAFADGDREALIEACHPEVEIHAVTNVVAGREGAYHGPEGVGEYLDDVARIWDSVELQPHQLVELGPGRVLVIGRVRTRRGATRLDVPNAWLWELEGERVRSVRLFVDPETIPVLLAERDANPVA